MRFEDATPASKILALYQSVPPSVLFASYVYCSAFRVRDEKGLSYALCAVVPCEAEASPLAVVLSALAHYFEEQLTKSF